MAKKVKAEFYYYINGKQYLLTQGKDGVTEEVITVLRDSYDSERLNERYEDELQDPLFKWAKGHYNSSPESYVCDPVDTLIDSSQIPEGDLFKEDLPPSLRDRVHDLIPHLIPAQQELFWQLCEGRQLVDIAREEGTTPDAIRSRRRKMFDRIRKLYEETYGER